MCGVPRNGSLTPQNPVSHRQTPPRIGYFPPPGRQRLIAAVETKAGPSRTMAVTTPVDHPGRSGSGHSRTTARALPVVLPPRRPRPALRPPARPAVARGGPRLRSADGPPGRMQMGSLKAERFSRSESSGGLGRLNFRAKPPGRPDVRSARKPRQGWPSPDAHVKSQFFRPVAIVFIC